MKRTEERESELENSMYITNYIPLKCTEYIN